MPEAAGPPFAETGRIVLGMPHLCPGGLSENWLWKELGHRHWELTGRAFGRGAAGFGSGDGEPVYAAFRRIALLGGDLAALRENDVLELRSTLAQLSATRVVSRHRAGHGGRLVAEVEMISAFVRRHAPGANRSIARVRLDPSASAVRAGDRARLAEDGLRGRGDRAREEEPAPDGGEIGTFAFEPCPHLDFNGAGLLYFSSFVAAVDRAEWRLLGRTTPLASTRERRATFHGNVEPGEGLSLRLLAVPGLGVRAHRALIASGSDGRLLAEIDTLRAP